MEGEAMTLERVKEFLLREGLLLDEGDDTNLRKIARCIHEKWMSGSSGDEYTKIAQSFGPDAIETVLQKLFYPDLKVGSIVQVNPETDVVFGAAMLTVTEVKPWGVKGFVYIPSRTGTSQSWYNARYGRFSETGGMAPFLPKEYADV